MRFLIADDHSMVREGLRAVLSEFLPGAEVYTAGSFEGAILGAKQHAKIALVLLDLNMPGMHGPASVRDFCEAVPLTPVIILSGSEAPKDIQQSLANGAQGYIPKSASPEVLLSAIRLVLAGGVYVPAMLLVAPKPAPETSRLTARQIDVLRSLAEGRSNKEIARDLSISEGTVKSHLDIVLSELGAKNRTQAVLLAQRFGLI